MTEDSTAAHRFERQRWQADLLAFKDEPLIAALALYDMGADRWPDPAGNLVSSHIVGSKKHAPVLDIDVPVRLVPSTSPGHTHLYVDIPMPRWRMMFMLFGLYCAGVLEMGNFWWSFRRGATFVRTQDVQKTEAESGKYTYGMFLKLKEHRGRR